MMADGAVEAVQEIAIKVNDKYAEMTARNLPPEQQAILDEYSGAIAGKITEMLVR